MTREEIIALQKELGVKADGVIGPVTRAAAQAKINEQAALFGENANVFENTDLGQVANTTGIVTGVETQPATTNVPTNESSSSSESSANNELQNALDIANNLIQSLMQNLQNQQQQYEPPQQNFSFAPQTQTYTPTLNEAKALYPYFSEEVLRIIINSWTSTGSVDIALASARATDEYAKLFPGIRRDDGTLRMTEVQYLEAKDVMRDSLRTYNLNPDIFENEIIDAISNDVDVQEFSARLEFGYTQLVKQRDLVKNIYATEYGMDLTDEALFAMFISPDIATSVLENQILVSQILAEAEVADISLARPVIEEFIAADIGQDKSREILARTTELKGLAGVAARRGIDLKEGDIALGLSGLSPEQLKLLKSAEAMSASESSIVTGAATTSLGEVAGLEAL